MKLPELPTDIIILVFPYLQPKDFLALCSTCKPLHSLLHDNVFWRVVTTSTFRLPNRPSAPNDGELWKKLYRRLLTQTKVYLWGQHPTFRKWDRTNYTSTFPPQHGPPAESQNIFELPLDTKVTGTIADLQVGGWSSTMLTSKGGLYTIGTLNNEAFDQIGQEEVFTQLEFPQSIANQNPERTAIAQFSVGRKIVLGLSDDKTIWLWYNKEQPALEICLPSLTNLLESTPSQEQESPDSAHSSKVSRVVCGWNHNSAYIRGQGIVVWPNENWRDFKQDSVSKVEPGYSIVNRSSYIRYPESKKQNVLSTDSDDESLEDGEVVSYVLLENMIIFVTDVGRVFTTRIPSFIPGDGGRTITQEPWPLSYEIKQLRGSVEVQGSFRSFGIFMPKGRVLVCKQNEVMEWLRISSEEQAEFPSSTIPALQENNVIQLAFGDYHFHALHADGSITSYNSDPQRVGALALSPSRGLVPSGPNDRLLPHGYINGRRIWIHESQQDFAKAHDTNRRFQLLETRPFAPFVFTPEQATARFEIGEFSEWMEYEGSDWHKWPAVAAVNEDGLAPYFALNVAAGGWSSGAVILVNEDVALKIKEVYENEQKQRLVGPVNVRLGGNRQWHSGGDMQEWKKEPPRFAFLETEDRSKEVFGFPGWREA